MKKLFTLVVLMCLLGGSQVKAGNDYIFFGTGPDNIFHNIVKPRTSVDEVATVDCYFRYYQPWNGNLKTDDYVNYNFKIEIIGDLQMTDDSALRYNGHERGDFTAMFQLKFKGRGGAIIVTAKHKNYDNETYGWATFFVITAPYIGNQTWDFFTNPNTEMTYYHANNRYEYWKPGTKFNGHEDRPIRVVDMDYDKEDGKRNDGHDNIDGTNARYLPATAGLIFTCPDEGFGVNDNEKEFTGNDGQPTHLNKRYVTFGKRGTLTIPKLKGGTYVRIWWDCINAGEHGGHFLADGLLDLDGKTINSEFTISGVTDYDMCQGNTIFKVAGNSDQYYDVSFTLNDDGWNDIYKIQVMDTYETDMILADGTAGWNNMHTVLYNNDFGTIVDNGSGASRMYSGHSGKSHIQRARTLEWKVSKEGNVTYTESYDSWTHDGKTYYKDLKLDDIKGTGNIKIIQREMFDGYVLDKKETWLAVGTYTQQSYPYTWDFTDYNVKQSELYAALTASSTYGEDKYGYWKVNPNNSEDFSLITHQPVDASDNINGKPWMNEKIEKPLFAQGAQLTYYSVDANENSDIKIIKETEGLRVEQFWGSEIGVGETYDSEISNNGKHLKFTPTTEPNNHKFRLTIPNVTSGMWVFVRATDQPNSVYVGNTELKANAKYNTADDVWAYPVSETGDVKILYAKSTSIKAIGVTNIFKTINALGYATESRNHAIDHEYEGVFTKNDVNAFCIRTYNNGFTYDYKGTAEVRKSTEVKYVPDNTGIVLFKDNHNGEAFDVPLFYPACNGSIKSTEQIAFDGNWMAPNVTSKDHTSETEMWKGVMCTKFGMSRQYYVYNKTFDSNSELQEDRMEVEAFYRLRLNSGANGASNTMGANKAYLLIPTSNLPTALWANSNSGNGVNAKPGVIYMDLEDMFGVEEPISGIATAIDTIESTETVGNGNTFHTLSGMQIQGVPTQKGVYIVNGKKVLVK